MSTEANKTLVLRLFDEGGKVSFAATDELLAEDFRFYFPGTPEPLGKEGWKQVYSMFLSAFLDLHYDIEDIIAEGDRVVARITWSGTQQREFQGTPPTGRRVTFAGFNVNRIEGGTIVEQYAQFDALGLMQQLGVLPAMG
jgi:steroid delta-isomerase-like uncharacterized protein